MYSQACTQVSVAVFTCCLVHALCEHGNGRMGTQNETKMFIVVVGGGLERKLHS